MATSGTRVFTLSFAEIVEEAYERCGVTIRTGYEVRTARRSLNLLLLEWANRGLNLWTVEQGTTVLTSNVATYNLPVDTVDLLECIIRKDNTDIVISRIGFSTYSTIPNKTNTGRPVQIYVARETEIPTFTVWPVPDVSGYSLVYWRLRRMDDAGTGVNTSDVPFRFLPVLTAGLAFYLSQKVPGAEMKTMSLQTEYERQWLLASDEDRQRVSHRAVPRRNPL